MKNVLTGLKSVFSDLNLNADSPVRVQPMIGEWGTKRIPTTKQKKRARVITVIVLCAVITALFLLGKFFFTILMGGNI